MSLKSEGIAVPEARPDAPAMPRFTLRTMPPSFVSDAPVRYTMRYDLASRVFRSSDDLTISLADDDYRLRPIQEFAQSPEWTDPNTSFRASDGSIISTSNSISIKARSSVTGPLYRKYMGHYSWFYVVEPSLAETFVPVTEQQKTLAMMPRTGGPYGGVRSARQYRVWVVVCQQRDLRALPDPDNIALPGEKGLGERFVWVDFLDRGTVRLRVGGIETEAGAMKALDVRTNQWIAVLGRYSEPAIATLPTKRGAPPMRYVMEWYRITGVANRPEAEGDTGVWFREATVAGRDFFGLGFDFFDDDVHHYPDIGDSFEPITGWGVIVKGVRAVYEKTMYDDGRSLWSM
jgi:hypothetical protein